MLPLNYTIKKKNWKFDEYVCSYKNYEKIILYNFIQFYTYKIIT